MIEKNLTPKEEIRIMSFLKPALDAFCFELLGKLYMQRAKYELNKQKDNNCFLTKEHISFLDEMIFVLNKKIQETN